jgi:hypothetical protein
LFTNSLQDFQSSYGLHIRARNHLQNAHRTESHPRFEGIAAMRLIHDSHSAYVDSRLERLASGRRRRRLSRQDAGPRPGAQKDAQAPRKDPVA